MVTIYYLQIINHLSTKWALLKNYPVGGGKFGLRTRLFGINLNISGRAMVIKSIPLLL